MALLGSQTEPEYFLTKLDGWFDYMNGKDPFAEEFPTYSPGGMLTYTNWGKFEGIWLGEFGPLKFGNNAALIATVAAKHIAKNAAKKRELIQWAQGQIWYTLGDNPAGVSYQIGYGTKYPLRPFHVGSSCPAFDESCGCPWFYRDEANPVELLGAVVGGPDFNDRYSDNR